MKIFREPKKIYWFFISLLITRATVSSREFKTIIGKIKRSTEPVLYFYWGDNLVWTIPYIYSKIKCCKPKIVIRFHNSDLYEEIKDGYAPIRAKVFSLATGLVTISNHGRNYLATKYPEFSNKLRVSVLGVADRGINPFHYGHEFTIVSVSNVVPVKRVRLIYEALQASGKKIHWHHFGDGPLLEELRTAVLGRRKGLKITLHGHISQQELMFFYNATAVDLLVNVSTTEGIPVSIMEALSFGIPVIATNVGGVAELVDQNVGGLLRADFRTRELSRMIDCFCSRSLKKAVRIRSNARRAFIEKVYAVRNYQKFYDYIQNLPAA